VPTTKPKSTSHLVACAVIIQPRLCCDSRALGFSWTPNCDRVAVLPSEGHRPANARVSVAGNSRGSVTRLAACRNPRSAHRPGNHAARRIIVQPGSARQSYHCVAAPIPSCIEQHVFCFRIASIALRLCNVLGRTLLPHVDPSLAPEPEIQLWEIASSCDACDGLRSGDGQPEVISSPVGLVPNALVLSGLANSRSATRKLTDAVLCVQVAQPHYSKRAGWAHASSGS
jgi:hypothetical protein